jgi:hypothetical protein
MAARPLKARGVGGLAHQRQQGGRGGVRSSACFPHQVQGMSDRVHVPFYPRYTGFRGHDMATPATRSFAEVCISPNRGPIDLFMPWTGYECPISQCAVAAAH